MTTTDVIRLRDQLDQLVATITDTLELLEPHRRSAVPIAPRSELAWALAMLERAHRAEGCATTRKTRDEGAEGSRADVTARDEMITRAARAAVEVFEAWFDGRPTS